MRVRYTQSLEGPVEALEALEGFAFRCERQLERLRLPPLYSAGVRYRRERGTHWATPREVWRAKGGDCEDLSAWRIAELRLSGQDPEATFALRHSGKPGLWHVVVRRGDGTLEDPSAVLGMKRRRRPDRR